MQMQIIIIIICIIYTLLLLLLINKKYEMSIKDDWGTTGEDEAQVFLLRSIMLHMSFCMSQDKRWCWDVNAHTRAEAHTHTRIYAAQLINMKTHTATVQRNVTYRLSHSLERGKQDRTTERLRRFTHTLKDQHLHTITLLYLVYSCFSLFEK